MKPELEREQGQAIGGPTERRSWHRSFFSHTRATSRRSWGGCTNVVGERIVDRFRDGPLALPPVHEHYHQQKLNHPEHRDDGPGASMQTSRLWCGSHLFARLVNHDGFLNSIRAYGLIRSACLAIPH